MTELYYIINDGRQEGPFVREELRYHGLKAESYVWKEGLPDWVQASTLPELTHLLYEDSAFGSYAQAPQPPYNHPSAPQQPTYAPGSGGDFNRGYVPAYTNWLPWAIACTVTGIFFGGCLTLILGIIGIVQANKANNLYARGAYDQAAGANSTAKTVTIIGLIISAIVLISIIILFSVGGMTEIIEAAANLK
ncbi:MAG: GYF domain-containing protein [Muribaculaceae bacterium]|nr:GYF domain-containing protein [Muribaculaceae bacterium]